MKRITDISKGMTSQQKSSNPVPNFSNVKLTNFKPMPNLVKFTRHFVASDLDEFDNRKIGIYKFKRNEIRYKGTELTSLIFTYKLGKIRYQINSCIRIIEYGTTKIGYGRIKISKGLFNKKEFRLEDLSQNIQNSINKNITKFNEEYKKILLVEEEKEKETKAKQKIKNEKFFKGLNLE